MGLLGSAFPLSFSKTQALLDQLLGVEMSRGAIAKVRKRLSAVLAEPMAQALEAARQQPVAWLSSHPGELPPEVLPEPYVTLSRHTAPIIHSPQHRHLASEQTGLIVAA